MIPHRVVSALLLIVALLTGCDQTEEDVSAVSVSFFEVNRADSVMVGMSAIPVITLPLDLAFRDTLALSEGTFNYRVSTEEAIVGDPFVVLIFGDLGSPYRTASVIFQPSGGREQVVSRGGGTQAKDPTPQYAARETPVTVFALRNGDQPVSGTLRFVFEDDEARAFEVDLAAHAVRAPPAVHVRGSELAWRGNASSFAFRIRGVSPERFVPLSLYKFEFARETEHCTSLGPRWDVATYNGVGFCTAVEPSTFEYRLFMLENE